MSDLEEAVLVAEVQVPTQAEEEAAAEALQAVQVAVQVHTPAAVEAAAEALQVVQVAVQVHIPAVVEAAVVMALRVGAEVETLPMTMETVVQYTLRKCLTILMTMMIMTVNKVANIQILVSISLLQNRTFLMQKNQQKV